MKITVWYLVDVYILMLDIDSHFAKGWVAHEMYARFLQIPTIWKFVN